jgi:hypothetical protein
MKLSKVLIYAAVLLCLAGWLYFYEIKHKEKTKAEKETAEKVLSLNKGDIVGFELRMKDGATIELVKPAGQWVMSAPIRNKADDHAVDSLLHSVTAGKREKLLKEKDVNWAEYGLDSPELTLVLKTKDKSDKVAFGEKNPSKSSYYVRVNDNPELLLVADTLRNSVNKSVFDLRDKTVLGMAPDDVDRFVVDLEGKKTVLQREGGDEWTLSEPEKMKAKKSVINASLRTLTTLAAKKIIDEPEKEGDPYGLDKPEVIVELEGKKLQQTLLVGSSTEKEVKEEKKPGAPALTPDRYARIKGRDAVYVIEGVTLKNLKKDPEEYKDKALLSFEPARIEKVSVSLEGRTYTASLDTDKTWNLESPSKGKAESWAVTGIIWTIRDLEWKALKKDASASLAEFGLDSPKLLVSLTKKGQAEPLTLKAAWTEPKKTKPEDKEKQAAPKPEDPAGGAEAATESDVKESPTPSMVFAVAQPSDNKDAVFVLDGAFLKRLRDELGRMTEEKDKKAGKEKK